MAQFTLSLVINKLSIAKTTPPEKLLGITKCFKEPFYSLKEILNFKFQLDVFYLHYVFIVCT